ncbi:uncharacterized protein LOC124204625 [Daphnia pulex]|uniref:uncharacterized protein LOC124204625 n=1 Tax=Daphnia pulex TaxID=6669 RepID=UPI001EDEBB7A|nr:uncharacterized protein LOC124204625 [Daphnia pulex]
MAAADTSPGMTPSDRYTEQHAAEEMKKWVVNELNADVETKFYEDAVNHIESIVGRQISCLETTWVERQYVKIVLEMWFRACFEKAFTDLEKSFDFNTQTSELLQQLKPINSFEDIHHKLTAESKLRDWCKSQYLELILGQPSLFKTTPRFAILVPSYFQHFKSSLTNQILSRYRKDLTDDQIDKLIRQIDEKEAQLHRLSCQRSQQREEFRQCYVKPSASRTTKVQNSLSSFTVGQRGCRPAVDLHFQHLSSKITCLDLLPTVNGNDSALHSILGRMNSAGLYVCADTNKFRQQIVDFFHNKENEANQMIAVRNFVLRQNDGKAFPYASARKKEFLTCRQQNDDESQFDWLQPPELSEEYVCFIQSSLGELDLPEVEFLAEVLHITIYVYEDQNDSSSFKHKITFNPNSSLKQNHFVLYKGDGEWQRLKANDSLHQFCNQLPMDLLQSVTQQTNSFSTLNGLLTKWNHHDLIASIDMLNPEDGVTPDKLSQLLLEKHFDQLPTAEGEKNDAAIQRQLEQLAPDIRLLTERVLEYNKRNVSPVFYLYIVSKCTDPKDWKYEFLLLEMEERLTELPKNRSVWKEEILASLKNLDDQTMALIRNSLIMATDFGDCTFSTMEQILKMLPVKSESDEIGSENVDQLPIELLSQLPLNDWLYELRSKIWEKKVNQLNAGDLLRHGELETLMKEAVYLLLELEYQKGEKIYDTELVDIKELPELVDKLRKTLYPCTNSTESMKERNWETIMSIVEEEEQRKPVEERFDQQFSNIFHKIKNNMIHLEQRNLKQKQKNEKTKKKTGERLNELIKTLKDNMKKFYSRKWDTRQIEVEGSESSFLLAEYLHVYDSVVELVMGFTLRDTQRVAIMFLLKEFQTENNILVQVSTGEGKSLIVAGVAIFCALSGQKVDVVTSNDVLALRDSTLSKDDGGLRELYEFFKVGVANNCSQSQDDRVKAYNADVVYGELANFQRDYLLHTFYGLNIRGDRKLDFIIVDELDCMLLDRGSNILYLSHDIPGMEMLESLYVFIWERIQTSVQLDVIKSQVLYDLYGAIGKKDLETIHAPLKDKPTEQNELWHYLIQARIIDPYGRLLIKNVEENKIDCKDNPVLNPKLIFFFRKVIERERHIRIPEHLLAFVDRHLDTWLANALRALELKQDEDYVIDQDRTDTSPDLNPQVIIIDPDTGTDQTTSQWDGALHQFLQLKEGCKLTPQSLKAVFISNEVYINKYARLAGVSGTLGSQKERNYMMNSYYCDYVSIPTAFSKRFRFKTPKVLKTKESWLSSIINEIRETVLTPNEEEARSIVIFCQTIKDVNVIHNHLKINLPQLIANKKVHRYTRDYEQFTFEAKQLEIGHVIIATNLAGRGTDIKISDELLKNGGLHICMTYLPLNERIFMQAMGRSGRNGAPGSGILILFQCHDGMKTKETQEHSTDTELSVAKFFSMKDECHREELQRIARLQEDCKSTKNQIRCFDIFSKKYADLKNQMRDKEDVEIRLMCHSALDQWALWLDETDDVKMFNHTEYLKASLINKLQLSESPSDISWMLPGRSVALAKHLAQKKWGINFAKVLPQVITGPNKKAEARKNSASLLEKLVQSSDAFFYPVAPYYLAFLTIKEKKGENKQTCIIKKMLRSSETILNEHIRMQMSFYRKINQNLSQRHSFCVTNAYNQQKVNIANLLGHYINSIRTLLGSHYCSASDLEQAGIDGQKVDTLFEQLKTDCIVQPKLNDDETVPNKKAAIQHVAIIHNVDKPTSLEENLSSVFYKVSNPTWDEKKIEKEIKKEIEISCTRKSFWKNMVKKRVLKDAIDFVIMDESECDIEPKLDRKEKLIIDFTSKDYVFFISPMPYTAEEMKKKIVFREKYVKDILKENDYRRRKKTFELNKMGRLNLTQLKEFNAITKCQYQLMEDDLRGIHIDPVERKNILAELENQKIIDRQGYLAPDYNGQEFCYPQCPAYEDAVMGLLGRNFAIEIVIRQWLKSEEDSELLKAIELLPLNPHRNLLADLMAAHVIAGARVRDDVDLKQAIEKITEDKAERECLMKYLRSRQALYVPTKSPDDFSLDFIEREIHTKKGMDNVSTELFLFGLVGFDNHIIYKNKLSFTAFSQALISIVVGGGLMVGGYHLDKALGLGDVPSLCGVNFLVTKGTASLFNGIETFLLRNKSTWSDYRRQSIMNLVGNPAPFEKMSTIWKLLKSRKSMNQTSSPPRSFNEQNTILTENQNVRIVATTKSKLNHRYRNLVGNLIETINETVDSNTTQMKETLIKVWQSHNHEDIKRLVKEKMEKLKTDWFEKGEKWVSEVKQVVLREATLEPDKQKPTIPTEHLEDFTLKIRMVHVTVECLKQFRSELEIANLQLPSASTTDHFAVEMGERFYKKVVENMKSELTRKAEQIMELFPTELDLSEHEILTLKGMDNISADLDIFGLVGFDQHIIYENKWSPKTVSQPLASIAVGGGLMVGGYHLDQALGDLIRMLDNRKNMICSGNFGAVFRGFFNEKQVAIKRVPTDKIEFQEKEEKILCRFDHPNVIKLLQVTQNVDFRFYVFDLAAGTVDDFCDRIYRGKMPSDDEALKQMARGLLYIHGKQFAHLNIKPSSVFISTSEPVRLMIAKFGSCEATTDTGTFSIGHDNKGGAADWMAPEILEYFDHFDADSDDDGKKPVNVFSIASDTWSLGCLFFYFLTRGIHPYGEEDDTIRWNIVVEQNPVELETMQASNHEESKVYELIGDMIDTEPEKRISLETVVKELETLFPPFATSQEYRKHVQPTQDGNDDSSQKSSSTSQDIERGKVSKPTVSCGTSFENIDEVVEGKTPDAHDKDDDKNDKTRLKKEVECCNHCDKKFKLINKTMEELKKSTGNAQEKLGNLIESAIRSNLRSNERGEARNISSLHQLVKCYGEAQDEDWTETNTFQSCKRVVDHLITENTEKEFLNWYYEEAKNHLKNEPGLNEQIKKLSFLHQEGEMEYSVVKFYKGGALQNYLSVPISNWDDYYKPSGPIFLLALYQSIKGKTDLLSFPPPGVLTMDDPVKISRANSSVHIEVGEIKSTYKDEVIKKAMLQLRRSLLCFKWLDELLSKQNPSYGLIGNIFINGNCSATQKKSVTGKRKLTDYLEEEEILIKYKYKIYK